MPAWLYPVFVWVHKTWIGMRTHLSSNQLQNLLFHLIREFEVEKLRFTWMVNKSTVTRARRGKKKQQNASYFTNSSGMNCRFLSRISQSSCSRQFAAKKAIYLQSLEKWAKCTNKRSWTWESFLNTTELAFTCLFVLALGVPKWEFVNLKFYWP